MFTFFNTRLTAKAEGLLLNNAKAGVLIETNTLNVLYEENKDVRLIPASITKIVTLKLVFDALDTGKITKNTKVATSSYASSMGGSQIYLASGEEMIVNDLIKSVAIASANDAAVALAEHIAGTEKNFVNLMNNEVKRLNLKNTHFENCTGLPSSNHYTTAYDIAILASELINKHPDVLNYTSIYEDYIREDTKKFWLVNTNKMVKNINGVDGLKTGYLSECGYNLVCTKKENGMRLISVVLGSTTINERTTDTLSLLNYGFSNFELIKLFSKNQVVKTINKIKISTNDINIVIQDDIYFVKNKDEEFKSISYEIVLDEYKINHYQKENIGKIKISIKDQVLEYDLNIENSVNRTNFLQLLLELLNKIF